MYIYTPRVPILSDLNAPFLFPCSPQVHSPQRNVNKSFLPLHHSPSRSTYESNHGCTDGLRPYLPGVPIPTDWNAPVIGGFTRSNASDDWTCVDIRASPFGLMRLAHNCDLDHPFISAPYISKRGFVAVGELVV